MSDYKPGHKPAPSAYKPALPFTTFGDSDDGSGMMIVSPAKKPKTKLEKFPGTGYTISGTDSEFSGTEAVTAKKPVSSPRRTRSSKPSPAAPAPATTTAAAAAAAAATPRGRTQGPKTAASKTEAAAPRRRSPRKKIIADSPPPEDRLDPFPPKRTPMTVSDRPAITNRYGEKVTAPVDAAERLRQALVFLSDEGPENCLGFEEKLDGLEKWFHSNFPNGAGVHQPGEPDTEELARSVTWKIWSHRKRIEEGAEQWFVRGMFPDAKHMVKPVAPEGSQRWRALESGVQYGAPMYPKLQVLHAEQRAARVKEEKEKQAAAAAGPTNTATGATAVEEDSEDEDWDRLPRPEVWHRKEARRFPFGETPYMERVMSRQINADLRRGQLAKEKAQAGFLRPLFRAMSDWFGGKAEDYPTDDGSHWILPEVSNEQLWEAARKYGLDEAKKTTPKRKAAGDGNVVGGKRSRAY